MSELEIEESLKASKAIDGSWTAVDFIPSKNPEKESPYILEDNHSQELYKEVLMNQH